jgi:hypothetical protein
VLIAIFISFLMAYFDQLPWLLMFLNFILLPSQNPSRFAG